MSNTQIKTNYIKPEFTAEDFRLNPSNQEEVLKITPEGVFEWHGDAENILKNLTDPALSQMLNSLYKRDKQLKILLQQALEALKEAADCVKEGYMPDKMGHDWDETIAALQKQLEQRDEK